MMATKGFSYPLLIFIIFLFIGAGVVLKYLYSQQDDYSKKMEIERYTLLFPKEVTDSNLNISIRSVPNVKLSNQLRSLFFALEIIANDQKGDKVTILNKPVKIIVNFSGWDLTPYKKDSLSIYSSEDGSNWSKEITQIDFNKNTASSLVKKIRYFALVAERADIIAPTTIANISGNKKQDNQYTSKALITLDAKDNDGGLGVQYTLYRINNKEWQQYKSPLSLENKGNYKIDFFSADQDDNIEKEGSISFTIIDS